MSGSPNVAVVRRIHDSKGDPAVTQDVMAPNIDGDITPGFPGGGVHHGFECVVNDFFGPLFGRFDAFHPVAEEFFADGDHVIALGDQGLTKTGKNVQVRFIHLWTVREGKLAWLQQAADRLVVDRALSG